MDNNEVNDTQGAGGRQQQPYGQPQYGYDNQYYAPPKRKKTDKPRIAGGLLVVAGVFSLIMACMMIAGGAYISGGGTFDFGGGPVDISGVVLAADGTPIQNATLSIEGTHIIVTTDATGHYQMLGVPSGSQQLTIEKPGYNTLVHNIFIMGRMGHSDFDSDTIIIRDDTELNFSMTLGSSIYTYGDPDDAFGLKEFGPIIIAVGAVFLVFSIIEILGGIYALRTKRYSIAILGAILGIFSIGFGIGTILAIIALIVLMLANEDFKRNGNGNAPVQ